MARNIDRQERSNAKRESDLIHKVYTPSRILHACKGERERLHEREIQHYFIISSLALE